MLCEIKAVGPGYPFYGEVVTTPMRPLSELLTDDRVVVGPELLTRLGLTIGDELRVGSATFIINGTVAAEPDRLEIGFTLGPRVMMSPAGLDRTALLGLGSRVGYRVLVRLPGEATPAQVRAAAEPVRAAVVDPQFVEVETYAEAQPALRNALARVERFLGLVALVSLLIGGIGVAQAVRAWLAGRLDAIAVLRALGVRPREVFALYLGQTALLGLVGSVAGALVGVAVARLVPGFIGDLLPVQVEVGWQPAAMGRGVALGVGVAVLFALRPLFDVLRVPPVRVLRRDADPLPVSRGVATALFAVLAAGVTATATFQSGSLVRGVQFSVGLIVATAVLSAGAWLVVRAVGTTPRERSASRSRGTRAPRVGDPRRGGRARARCLNSARDVPRPGPDVGSARGRSSRRCADGVSCRHPARPVDWGARRAGGGRRREPGLGRGGDGPTPGHQLGAGG